MDPTWRLKLLSGQLAGVEYTLTEGDAVFCIGSRRDLVDGVIGETLARADNTYYITADGPGSSFVLRIGQGEAGIDISLGERASDTSAWAFRPLTLNVPVSVSGLHIAVRGHADAWAEAVRCFEAPHDAPARLAIAKARTAFPLASWRQRTLAGMAMVAVIGGGIWLAGMQAEHQRVSSATRLLAAAPFPLHVFPAEGGQLHVLGESAKGVAWARRAVARTPSLPQIHFADLSTERVRVNAALEKASLDAVVVRFTEPTVPEVVVASEQPLQPYIVTALRAKVMATLPFAKDVKVSTVTIARLENLARAELAAMNIPVRIQRDGAVSIISNEGYLDDAGLNALREASARFAVTWGTHRVAIHARLWDDVLKGRSYQYHPNQLLSVGGGRWEFSSSGRAN